MKKNPSLESASRGLRTALGALALLILLPVSSFATTFYVSSSGSDSNAGTQASPFLSITKAQSVASSGDTVLLRGGTYSSFTIAGSDSNYNFVHDITKSGITYAAFTGEIPIFNFSSITTAKRVAAFHIASGVSNVTFRGFQVTGVPVGTQKQSECFRIQGNAHFDRVTCHDNAANGFYFTSNGSGSCTNCDSYNNIGVGTSLGNTDGFGAHAGPVTFTGCRSWNNSDDGFDCISSSGQVVFDHCWAYDMRNGGDSNGFKVGGYGLTGPVANPMPSHIVRFCLSADNGSHGFYANHQPGKAADWTNNTAYNNSSGNFDMLEQVSATDRTNIPGTREVFHYNIAFTDTIINNDNNPAANKTNNSWTKSGVTVTSADFQSLDATQIMDPRQADGSLPVISFMRLASGSDLAGMGCFSGSFPPAGTYSLQNRSSGLMLDGMGRTTNGSNCGQWQDGSSNNQRWNLTYVSSNVVKLQCVTGGIYLDGMGRTANGSIAGLWANSSSNNQRWTIVDAGGGYVKLENVATGLCLDVGASPWANGDDVEQWPDGSSQNQQWQFVAP